MTTALAHQPAAPATPSARRSFWVTLGTDLTGADSYDQALAAAHLDWTTTLTDADPALTVPIDGNLIAATAPDRRLLIRSDTSAVLGMVGSRYTPVDNRDVFAVTELLAEHGATWVAGGPRDHGRTCFMLMRPADSTITVVDRTGNTDSIHCDALVRTGHGGTESLSYEIRATRKITSTSVAIMASSNSFPGMDPAIQVRHTASAPDRVSDAQQILSRTSRYMTGFARIAQKLVATPVGSQQLLAVVDGLWPRPKRNSDVHPINADAAASAAKAHTRRMQKWEDRRGRILGAFQREKFAAGTAYAAFITIADYLEWGVPTRGEERSVAVAKRAFADTARSLRSRALSQLLNPAVLYGN